MPGPVHPRVHPSIVEQGAAALAADAELDPLAEPELLTIHGDWHGRDGHAKRALREAAKADCRTHVQVGDFGVWSGRNGQLYLDVIEHYLAETQSILIVVDGNHEDYETLLQYPVSPRHGLRCIRPRLYHAPRGTRWNWGGLTWLALGGATSIDKANRTPFVDWWPQEEITWADAERAADGGIADVMLTHDCPAGVSIPNLPDPRQWDPVDLHRAYAHRMLLRQVVDVVRPTHLFHGHFHSRYTDELDLGNGLSCEVTGLDRDGTLTKSWKLLDLDELYLSSALRRAAETQSLTG